MILELNFESEIPIYIQIKHQIIEGIATGKLKPGEPLPSVRQFGSDLGINLHTVNKAYNLLRQDGFIIIHRQKGVVVNPGEGPLVTEDYIQQLKSDLKPMIAEAFCRGMPMEEFQSICTAMFEQLRKEGGKN